MRGLNGLSGVEAAFDRRLDPGSGAPLCLALSGGGDSMALLHIAAAWTRSAGRPLLALTVDHGLNEQSAGWTAFAGAAARRAGADWRSLSWTGPKPKTGLPAAARAARHRLLAEAARAAGARVMLFAHTADDVLEGERMREGEAPTLGRLREWAPSPVWPEGRGLFLLRPLLDVRRDALREALTESGAAWIEDPANADPRFARARARLASPAADPDRSDPVSAVQTTTLADAAQRIRATPDGRLILPRAALGDDVPSKRRLLSILAVCAGGGERPPRGEAIARLCMKLDSAAAFTATLVGARIIAGADVVLFAREAGDWRRRAAPDLALSRGETAVWDGRFEITAHMPLRVTPLAGFAARLPGSDRARLLALAPEARQALPLLCPDGPPRLPHPFSDGPAEVRALTGRRMAAAAGLVSSEANIASAADSCTGAMAQALHSPYVEALALA